MYESLDLTPKMCFRCLHFGLPKKKKGKDKWKNHYFICCEKCSSKVFFS